MWLIDVGVHIGEPCSNPLLIQGCDTSGRAAAVRDEHIARANEVKPTPARASTSSERSAPTDLAKARQRRAGSSRRTQADGRKRLLEGRNVHDRHIHEERQSDRPTANGSAKMPAKALSSSERALSALKAGTSSVS